MRCSLLSTISLCILLAASSSQAQLIKMGGGPREEHPPGDCISPSERANVEFNIARYHLLHGGPGLSIQSGPAPYPFHPQAGNLFEDLFVNNYTDLDSTNGFRDWDGTDWTYNGHHGHDVDLRTFGEQEIGVPIFAALDGTVVDTHDGEFDHNTSWNGQPANYVVLWHGGSHYTYYWHMRTWSVAVWVGQHIRAGTMIGMTGSSGISTEPHLHFESHYAGTWYEPYAGVARPGESNWVHQTPIRRDTYFRDFNITNVDISQYPGLPYDIPRTGTFLTGWQSIAWWINLINYTPNSTWRVRFVRPDESILYDSGTHGFGQNAHYRWSWWWWRYIFYFDQPGTWHVELSINQQTVRAPFTVVQNPEEIVNRPPNPPVSMEFDPTNPNTEDVLFCRVHPSLFDDPDYDIVAYNYLWIVNGNLVRYWTSAANSDALPAGTALPGDSVTCIVTPTDGHSEGAPLMLWTVYQGDRGMQMGGRVVLEDAVDWSQWVTFEFRSINGTPPFSKRTLLASDGSYMLGGIPPDIYIIAVKGSKWLRNIDWADLHFDQTFSQNFYLFGGDANDDNSVDVFDLDVLIQAFNTTPFDDHWNEGADLNCDQSVDIFDLDLLIRNFNREGPP